jgi:DNA-binding cell septation regulator SpoVG
MRITNIDLKMNNGNSMAKAWGNVVFDEVLRINISILDNGRGPWVAFPGRKNKEGKWVSEVYLDTKESDVAKALAQEILDKYDEVKDGGGSDYQNNNYSNNMNAQSVSSDDIPF